MSVVISDKKLITAEQLAAMHDLERCELIDGEIIRMTPTGAEHGGISMEIAYRIKAFANSHGLGQVYAAETGFLIK